MSTEDSAPSSATQPPGVSLEPHYTVVVVGAGISGISVARHLQTMCPWASFVMLERRDAIGGTWDLNRYPGVRSDSDMFTFGFWWRAWGELKVIAPGDSILKYLNGAVDDEGLRPHLHLGVNVLSASWDTSTQTWTLVTSAGTVTCDFIHMATGYYSYEHPYKPDIPGLDTFQGPVIHPQEWKQSDTDACVGKRVAVIGSGATAATLVPALADVATRVTMVQRSPTYFVARPAEGGPLLRRVHTVCSWLLSPHLAHVATLWALVWEQRLGYWFSRQFPQTTRKAIMNDIRQHVPPDFDVDTHFNPSYDPWDQRICLVPDGDFFKALREGKAEVVTDTIATVTPNAIQLDSGTTVDADVIVTATGLTLQRNFPMSTMNVSVDGTPYVAPNAMIYKSCMLSGVPNLTFTVGYVNASWTLKADLVSYRLCRLLQHMRKYGYGSCCPSASNVAPADDSPLALTSGYVLRAQDTMPKLGKVYPWTSEQNYLLDLWRVWPWERFEDGFLKFRPLGRTGRYQAPLSSL
eukprot:m.35708 g.35708  ORF g.35708 m.35708 type:complete len:521 (+) comp5315_c0_seq1:107-1669(+)